MLMNYPNTAPDLVAEQLKEQERQRHQAIVPMLAEAAGKGIGATTKNMIINPLLDLYNRTLGDPTKASGYKTPQQIAAEAAARNSWVDANRSIMEQDDQASDYDPEAAQMAAQDEIRRKYAERVSRSLGNSMITTR